MADVIRPIFGSRPRPVLDCIDQLHRWQDERNADLLRMAEQAKRANLQSAFDPGDGVNPTIYAR